MTKLYSWFRLAAIDRRAARGFFCTLATFLVTATALAETSPRPPSASQIAQPGQIARPIETQLTFSPWVKLCNKAPDPAAKRICVTVKDGHTEQGLLRVSVAVVEVDSEQRKLVRVVFPYGVQLAVGTRMIIDQGAPATAPYVTCLPQVVPPGGCIADYEATADMITRMKEGQVLTVQAIHMNNQPMSPQLDLRDFAAAYDGPPTDPQVSVDQPKTQQRRLRDDSLDPRYWPWRPN